MIVHPIPPLFDGNSKILILGSFPSVKSREAGFFYGHPQNRFWKVVSGVLKWELPKTVEEKKAMLFSNNIALWDVIGKCDITGSADSAISNPKANDLGLILKSAEIKAIFTNGRKAQELYKKQIEPEIGISAIYLPSTSPANAAWSIEKLIDEWNIIKEYL